MLLAARSDAVPRRGRLGPVLQKEQRTCLWPKAETGAEEGFPTEMNGICLDSMSKTVALSLEGTALASEIIMGQWRSLRRRLAPSLEHSPDSTSSNGE